jgi:hypothetical protein
VSDLFCMSPLCDVREVSDLLDQKHYLGRAGRGWAWWDDYGVMVFANPSSRRLPQKRWLELIRWCLTGGPNAGSQQWAAVSRYIRTAHPHVTTVVSYSDPTAGHTGALYRACNWLWAPTWLRLRPPPSGNGDWGTGQQATKDRWVFPLRRDAERVPLLVAQDESLLRRDPWLRYSEPAGVDYRRWIALQPAPIIHVYDCDMGVDCNCGASWRAA